MAETYYVKPENSPVDNVTLNSYDAMFIANGGIANDTVVNSDGAATVNDGGSANNTTVNEGGTLHLIGGAATDISVASDGRLEVNKGATATGIEAEKGATLVFDVAASTHIAGTSDGAAFQIQNGIATGFALETGVLTISSGGTALNATLNSAGFINVSQGGSADKAVINTSGELKVSSGGTATEATVKTGGKLTVESSGFCDDATVEMNGNLYVISSGGTAAGTYIGAMGNLAVSKGGTAYGTTVGAGGFLTVGTKGIAEGADVNGFLNVLDGGLASNVTVNEGAVVYVQSKGTGSDVYVDYGGILEVLSDGRLKGATVAQGGSATIHADVMASNVVVDGGKVTVMSDGWAYQSGVSSNTIVQNGGRLIVSGGGYVVGAAVSAGGHVTVESDATFSSATVADADVTALDGACVSRLNLEAGGILNVVSGGKAEHINVSAGGVLTGILREASELKFYGGTLDLNIAGVSPDSEALVDEISFLSIMPVAEDYLCTLTVSDTQAEGAYKLIEGASGFDTSKAITVKDTSGTTLGTLTVNGGSTTIGGVNYTLAVTTEDVLTVTIAASDITPPVDLTGNLTSKYDLEAGKYASSVNILEGGKLNVYKDALASQTTVNSGGTLFISEGGIASDTTLNDNGKFRVLGTASKTAIAAGGSMNVHGSADSATVAAGGRLVISSGGKVSNITAELDGAMDIESGASATGIVAAKGARMTLRIAPNTYVQGTYDGNAFELKDAVLSGFTLKTIGVVNVLDGGVTSDVTLSGGLIRVYNGSVAKDTLVSAGGELMLREEGAVANGVTIKNGGKLTFSEAGGKLTGKVTIETGANVTVEDGAIVDFDLTKTTTADPALVNNLSFFGTAAVNYTLTVDGTAADGDYKLAENATGFDKTITVVNTSGVTLGTLTVGEVEKVIGGQKYTLTLNGTGSLGVTLGDGGGIPDTTPPDKPIPDASSKEPTNGYVIVTATFSDDSVLRECSKDGENWVEYQSSGLTFVENGKAYFRATDGAGNVSDIAVYEVTNIDKVAPTISYITPSTTAPAASVTVTASFDDDVSLASTQYRIGVGAWQDYTTGVTVTENTTVYFKAVDAAGNESEVKEYKVTNIIITGDITGKEYVSSGGMASGATVKAGGSLNILSDGVARDTLISAGGKLTVVGGGKLTGSMTFEDTASVTVQQYGIVDFDISKLAPSNAALVNNLSVIQGKPTYTLTVGASQAEGTYTLAGGASSFSSSITVKDTLGTELDKFYSVNQSLIIGGMVYTLTLTDDVLAVTIAGAGGGVDLTGDLDTTSGLAAGMVGSSVNILDGGNLEVFEGGFTSQTTVNSGGDLAVSEGGVADVVTVNFGGDLYVRNGGVATLVKENGGYVGVNDGATATFVSNSFGGYVYNNADDWCTIHSGTTGTDLTVGNDGVIFVYSGGTAVDTTVAANGYFYVYGGGTATGIVAAEGAELYFYVAPNTYAQGTYGGSAFEITDTVTGYAVHSGGALQVCDGCKADAVTVDYGGNLWVNPGGTATSVMENGGEILIWDGATVTFVPHEFTGVHVKSQFHSATVHSGTTATDTTVSEDGELHVFSGGIAKNTTVNEAGFVCLFGGIASDTTVNENGNVYVYVGGTADGVTVHKDGAYLYVESGGKLTGKVTIETGADVTVYDGAIVDFDLTKTTTGADALVNDLSFFKGVAVKYTLTVDGTQASGAYKLAGNVASFNKIISVKSVLGEDYGYLTFGGTLSTSFADYTLALADDNTLTVNVAAKGGSDTTPPTVTNIKASTTEPTNQNVTVTADFNDNVGLKSKLYQIDGGAWQDYTAGGVVMTKSGTVYFMAVDTSDNESAMWGITVDNIDKVAPTITGITPSTTAPAKSVTVTATFADDWALALQQFKIGDGAWQDYTTGVTVTENGTVYFKAVDIAGNEVEDEYTVTNIETSTPDITPPTITITPSTTAPAKSVTLTAVFDDDVAVATKEYMIDSEGVWKSYTGPVTVTENVYVSFRATDTSENGTVQGYNVTNIDSSAPEKGLAEPLNDWLFNKKDKTDPVNTALTNSVGTKLAASADPIQIYFDSTPSGTLNNFVGMVPEEGGSVTLDELDYAKVVLDHGAELSFSIDYTDAAKFTIWQLVPDKKKEGAYSSAKSVQATTLKNKDATLITGSGTKPIRLEAGSYYLSMQSTNAKKGGQNEYNVTATGTFFDLGDNSDDWTNMKTVGYGAGAEIDDLGIVDKDTDTLVENEWTGFGDAVDYKKITLAKAANLSFLFTTLGIDTVKFSVCQLKTTTKKGSDPTYSQGWNKSVTVKAKDSLGTLNGLMLEAGEYYIKIQNTNAKKSNGTGYGVKIAQSDFYIDGDSNTNDYDSKAKAVKAEVKNMTAVKLVQNNPLQIDGVLAADAGQVIEHDGFTNFVGFGDANDVVKINAAAGDTLSLMVTSTDAVSLTLYGLKNGKVTSIKSVKSRNNVATIDSFTFQEKNGTEFYVGVEATNAKKGEKAWYKVDVISFSGADGDALAMPETDSLAMTDELSFAQYGADALADVSASPLADLNADSAWQNLASLA